MLMMPHQGRYYHHQDPVRAHCGRWIWIWHWCAATPGCAVVRRSCSLRWLLTERHPTVRRDKELSCVAKWHRAAPPDRQLHQAHLPMGGRVPPRAVSSDRAVQIQRQFIRRDAAACPASVADRGVRALRAKNITECICDFTSSLKRTLPLPSSLKNLLSLLSLLRCLHLRLPLAPSWMRNLISHLPFSRSRFRPLLLHLLRLPS